MIHEKTWLGKLNDYYADAIECDNTADLLAAVNHFYNNLQHLLLKVN